MTLQAGFAEIDITPPLGTEKIGWLKVIVSDAVLSPLFARAAVFKTPQAQIAFVQLDTLFIAWPEVAAIREGIAQRYGFPGAHVMVAATHNHAGPAVTHAGDVKKDEAYAALLVSKVVTVFGQALANLQDAEIDFGHTFEWNVAHNRRVVMRDGTVRTHGTFDDPRALYLEGPIDPEVAAVAVRAAPLGRGQAAPLLGVLVNFACHPTHHGGDTTLDAGFPGALAERLRAAGCPITLFLNGASGNVHTSNPCDGGRGKSAADVGDSLARDVLRVLDTLAFDDHTRGARDIHLGAASRVIDLPYRHTTAAEMKGAVKGAQRFIDPAIYDRAMATLAAKIRQREGLHRAEIQVLGLGEYAFVGVPGELFVEFGLQIKQAAYPRHACIVTCANGRVGYIPTRAAFQRGGYETTFGPGSMLAPEAGEMIVETAIDLIHALRCDKTNPNLGEPEPKLNHRP